MYISSEHFFHDLSDYAAKDRASVTNFTNITDITNYILPEVIHRYSYTFSKSSGQVFSTVDDVIQ